MQSETVELNGHPFFVRSWGDPSLPKILFLHGFPEYGGAWSDLAPKLSDRFHVIAPDQRGYGQSWAPEGVEMYTGSALTKDMVALIDHYGSGPVTVFGHDWGAAVAYGLAMFYPDHVSRLIIANGVHPVPFQRAMASGGAQSEASAYIGYLRRPDSHIKLAENNFEKMMDFFTRHMGTNWVDPDRAEEYKTEWARDGKLETMINWYRASPLRLAKPGEPITDLPEFPNDRLMVRCPHLLIWGEQDGALLPVATEGLEDFAPDLTRKNLPDADHWLIHTHAEEIAGIVREWMPD